MSRPIAYLCGKIVPEIELMIGPRDAGFMLGVTIAEQLRTFNGKLFGWPEHLARLRRGAEIMGWRDWLDLDCLENAANDIVRHNHGLLETGDDLGVTVFVTPGEYATYRTHAASSPTVGIHTYPLPFSQWATKYEQGQRCVISSVQQVGKHCWPRALKCRSRAHYYLADQQARQHDADARAILLDDLGAVNEATTANVVAFFSGEGLVSPPLEDVLPGTSLHYVAGLAASANFGFTYRSLPVDELRRADEILLTSTPFCLLPVSSLDGQPVAHPDGGAAQRLLADWSSRVGCDIVAQAKRFANR